MSNFILGNKEQKKYYYWKSRLGRYIDNGTVTKSAKGKRWLVLSKQDSDYFYDVLVKLGASRLERALIAWRIPNNELDTFRKGFDVPNIKYTKISLSSLNSYLEIEPNLDFLLENANWYDSYSEEGISIILKLETWKIQFYRFIVRRNNKRNKIREALNLNAT